MPASPRTTTSDGEDAPRVLIVGCGALARELVELTRDLPNVDITCLPATLHNRPGGIPAAVRERIRRRRAGYDRVFVAYADCGTGGLLDLALAEEPGVERLPGAHCYEFYAGRPDFARLTADEPATFFLTDFLARNFDRLVIVGLGLDRHPELLPAYFGNYERLVYLAQADDPALVTAARRGARRLGLRFELRRTGLRRTGDVDRRGRLSGWASPRRLRHRGGALTMGAMTVIWWRDIPAQVLARDGRRQSKQVLHPRFQVAIDKAAARAGKSSYNDYIEEWRREQQRCGDDIEVVVAAETERLETEYTKHRLAELIQSGGVEGGPALAPARETPIPRRGDATT